MKSSFTLRMWRSWTQDSYAYENWTHTKENIYCGDAEPDLSDGMKAYKGFEIIIQKDERGDCKRDF